MFSKRRGSDPAHYFRSRGASGKRYTGVMIVVNIAVAMATSGDYSSTAERQAMSATRHPPTQGPQRNPASSDAQGSRKWTAVRVTTVDAQNPPYPPRCHNAKRVLNVSQASARGKRSRSTRDVNRGSRRKPSSSGSPRLIILMTRSRYACSRWFSAASASPRPT